jgi:hypothetical protein
MPTSIRLGLKGLPGTYSVAYFALVAVMKLENVYNIDFRIIIAFDFFSPQIFFW